MKEAIIIFTVLLLLLLVISVFGGAVRRTSPMPTGYYWPGREGYASASPANPASKMQALVKQAGGEHFKMHPKYRSSFQDGPMAPTPTPMAMPAVPAAPLSAAGSMAGKKAPAAMPTPTPMTAASGAVEAFRGSAQYASF
jgi:hypothetical protein